MPAASCTNACEYFYGTAVEISKTVKNIGDYAFGYILSSESDAVEPYEKCEDFVIFCSPGSTAEEYAKKNGFICKPLAE